MSKMYSCSVRLGPRLGPNTLLWVKSAEFVGDSIVIDFSPDRCFISEDLACAASKILSVASKRPQKWIQVVTCSSFDFLDAAATPSEEVSGNE